MKVLVVSHPIPGHALFLTGPARRLHERGHEVVWLSGESLRGTVEALGVRFVPFTRTVEHTTTNLDELYPKRVGLKGPMQARHDGEKLFAAPVADLMADITELRDDFDFEVVLLDMSTYVTAPLKLLFGVPVVSAAAISSLEPDPWVPPLWLGLVPNRTPLGRLRDAVLGWVSRTLVMGPTYKTYNARLAELGVPGPRDMALDPYLLSDAVVQQGLAEFEFPRKHPNPRVHHVGPLLPWRPPAEPTFEEAEVARRRAEFDRCVLVTQGTVDEDVTKLIEPTIKACRLSPVRTLVVATGGDATEALRAQFPGQDVIVAPRLDFTRVLPHADVYVTNGGFGGVTLALTHGVPIVGAGISEGKADCLSHVGYHRVGLNLRTEKPTVERLGAAIETCATDPDIRARARAFGDASRDLDPDGAVADLVEQVVARTADR